MFLLCDCCWNIATTWASRTSHSRHHSQCHEGWQVCRIRIDMNGVPREDRYSYCKDDPPPPRKNEKTYEDDRWCVHVKISSTEIFDFPPHDIMIYTSNFHHPSRTTKVTASQLPKLPLRSPCKWCINSLLSILPSFLAFQRSWRFTRWLVQKKMNSRNRC